MEPGVTTLASRSAASQYTVVISCDSIISLLGTEYPPLSVEDKFQGCNGCLKPWQHQTLYANAFSSSTMVFHIITRLLKVGEIKISMHFFFKISQKMSYCLLTCLLLGVVTYVCMHAVVTEQHAQVSSLLLPWGPWASCASQHRVRWGGQQVVNVRIPHKHWLLWDWEVGTEGTSWPQVSNGKVGWNFRILYTGLCILIQFKRLHNHSKT